jgi:hypothetical protein
MKLVEVDRYTTKPPDSINRHSIRVYYQSRKIGGRVIFLNRTTDANPRFFEAYSAGTISQTINVDGGRYWGDGLSWPKAIKKLEQALW